VSDELPRRIRTARCYAAISRTGLARALQTSVETIKRMELGTLTRDIKDSELLMISKTTGVPMWFLEGGWPASPQLGPAEVLEGEADRLDAQRQRNGEESPRSPKKAAG
jgi:hypothetical protein